MLKYCCRTHIRSQYMLETCQKVLLTVFAKMNFATGYIQWFLNIGRIYPVKNSIFLYFIKTRCFCEKTTENAKILFQNSHRVKIHATNVLESAFDYFCKNEFLHWIYPVFFQYSADISSRKQNFFLFYKNTWILLKNHRKC